MLASYLALHAAMFSGVEGAFAAYLAGASAIMTTLRDDACRMRGSGWQAG